MKGENKTQYVWCTTWNKYKRAIIVIIEFLHFILTSFAVYTMIHTTNREGIVLVFGFVIWSWWLYPFPSLLLYSATNLEYKYSL
jgi:hypothetical protein